MIFKISLVVLLPISLFANPSWLYNIKPTHKNEIVGYGVGTDMNHAKQSAIAEIVVLCKVKAVKTDIYCSEYSIIY